jgi:hypothetical protein
MRVPVASRYELAGHAYGFTTDRYDSDRELIIDPGLEITLPSLAARATSSGTAS